MLGVESRRYEHSGSKRHYAHRNVGHTYKSHRDNFSQFGRRSFEKSLKGGRVMIAFFVNYSTIAFPLHLPTLKRQQFFGVVANSLGKNSYFPLPLDVRRYVAPTGEEVDARQRGVN